MDSVKLNFNVSIFSADALLNTIYWFADKAKGELVQCGDEFVVTLSALEGALEQSDVDSFSAMAIHNQIRSQLKQTFAELETTLVERAFRPVTQKSQEGV